MDRTDARIAELEAACGALEAELQSTRGSLRYRLGTLVVDAFQRSGGGLSALPELVGLARQARVLLHTSRFAHAVLNGLPHNGLGSFAQPDPANHPLVRRLSRMAGRYDAGRWDSSVIERAAGSGDEWLARAAALAGESHALIADGFALAPRPATAPDLPRHVYYLVNADPLSVVNGYSRRTHELARALGRAGWRVTVVVRPDPSLASGGAKLLELEDVAYVRLPCPPRLQGIAAYVHHYAGAVAELAGRDPPGIVQAATPFANGLAGALASRALAVPLIYEVRGLWEITRSSHDPRFGSAIGFHLQRRLETEAALAASRVLVQSGGLRVELMRRGVPGDSIGLAANAAPEAPRVSAESRQPIRDRLGIPQDAVALGYIGSLVEYEGLRCLLRAFARLSPRLAQLHLLVIGDGPLRPVLQAEARRRGLEARVSLPGRVGLAEATAFYGAMDLVVCPRLTSPVAELVAPLKPYEAFAAGVPLIASDLAPIREMTLDGRLATLTPPGDEAKLAAAIEREVGNLEAARRRAEDARDHVLRSATWAHTAERIIEAYRAALGRAEPGGADRPMAHQRHG